MEVRKLKSVTLKEKAYENIVGKGEFAGSHHFLLFSTMFSTLPLTNFKSLSYV